jgi:hypothetical protein
VRRDDLDGVGVDPNEHTSETAISIGDRPDSVLAGADARLASAGTSTATQPVTSPVRGSMRATPRSPADRPPHRLHPSPPDPTRRR